MKVLDRACHWASVPLVLVAAVGAAAVVYPGGLPGLCADSAALPRADAENVEEAKRTNHLEGICRRLAERLILKDSLVDDLLDGRATLEVTAERFLELNRESESQMNLLRMQYPGLSDEELAARNVVDFVRSRLAGRPVASQALERVGRQYAARFGHPPGAQG